MRHLAIPIVILLLLAAKPGETGEASTERKTFEARSFVVIGEGLAAGIGDFSLTEEMQRWSFPAQLAGQIGTQFTQPLVQAPGLGDAPGLRALPLIAPAAQQTTILSELPGAVPNNLSIPNFSTADSLGRHFVPPLLQSGDSQQSLINMVLNAPPEASKSPMASQPELALQMKPTFVIVELGYYEAVEAAVKEDPRIIPSAAKFRSDYSAIVRSLRENGSQVLLLTVPDPSDTAYLSSLEAAAKLVKADAGLLRSTYHLAADDRVTAPGLMEIGYQLTDRSTHSLPKGTVMSAATSAEISGRVESLNLEISDIAERYGAAVYDLHDLFRRVKKNGVTVGQRQLSGNFLGGFFLLNGFYPGRTGHAIIANEVLGSIKEKWGASYAVIDVGKVRDDDPTCLAEPAPGPDFTRQSLRPLSPADMPPLPPLETSEVVGFMPATTSQGCAPPAGVPGCGLPISDLKNPLKLPPGLEEVLTLNSETSYYGDALRVVDCPQDQPLPGFEKFPSFGGCGNVLFGGLAIGDVNLNGKIKIKFSEPVNGISHFEISHPGGLRGESGTLQAPKFFRLPFQLSFLRDVPALVSSGDLDLASGTVTNLQYFTSIFNTALWSLIQVNPNLPKRPLAFPGPAGSFSAKFEQRPDGLLDVSLAINGFLPLGTALAGQTVRLPLPLCNPRFQCASIVTRGTSLHPHIHLSTNATGRLSRNPKWQRLPENSIHELTSVGHNNSFGDVFGLKIDELGGAATGRSHLLGRVQVQFGKRFGDSLPVAISILPPGGLLAGPPRLLQRMPFGVSPGFIGFDENLDFPNRSYQMKELGFSSDPWNISLAAVDLRDGHVVGELLHRGFVLQQLIFRLFEVEPCTPRTSFCYQGPATFASNRRGGIKFSFNGQVLLPYPSGYRFPQPSGDGAFVAGPDSQLEPFLRIQATSAEELRGMVMRGAAQVSSSTGQEFSYKYTLPCGPDEQKASFDYINHAQGGEFQLTGLTWASCTKSRFFNAGHRPEIVTFAGFGTWSKDPGRQLHTVAAQISSDGTQSYVGIQIDGGMTSNVNTRPERIEGAYPAALARSNQPSKLKRK